MTQQELKYLRRTKLREMLLEQYRENEQLQSQIKQLQEQMEQREIVIDNAGSIAEAAMQLNGVFDSAQKACDQYAESVEKLQERSRRICSRMEKNTREKCRKMEQETQKKCEQMVEDAKKQADAYWNDIFDKGRTLKDSRAVLETLFSNKVYQND